MLKFNNMSYFIKWLYVYEYLPLVVLIKMGKGPVACIDMLCVGRYSMQLLGYCSLATGSAICVDIMELNYHAS